MMDDFEKLGKAEGESTKEADDLLSRLKEGTEFEAQTGEHRTELLFKIATEIEETATNLKRAEQLVDKLKKHLKQLKDLQRVLSR
jgi:aminoglycoside N3'-acetyltransferase